MASYVKGSVAHLRQNWIRTILTLLGIIFGVSSVIAMITIGEGAQEQIMKKIEAMGANLVHITANKVEKSKISEIINDSEGLSLRDVRALENVIPMTGRAVGFVNKCMVDTTDLPVQTSDLGVFATSRNFVEVSQLNLVEGRDFSTADFLENASVALLGQVYAVEFFCAGGSAVGKYIRLNYKWFKIVGVFGNVEKAGKKKPKRKIPANLDYFSQSILIPITTYYEKMSPPKIYSDLDKIFIKCRDLGETNRIRDIGQRILALTHNQVEDFKIVSPLELLEQKKATQEVFNVVLLSIASISLLVGGIGIMNIMLANVMERRHEIGIRRALGAKKRHIIIQFLFESVFICLVGGIIGISLGMFISYCILHFTEIPIAFSVSPIILSFGISFLVGIIFGIIPAREAANLNPVEALHYE